MINIILITGFWYSRHVCSHWSEGLDAFRSRYDGVEKLRRDAGLSRFWWDDFQKIYCEQYKPTYCLHFYSEHKCQAWPLPTIAAYLCFHLDILDKLQGSLPKQSEILELWIMKAYFQTTNPLYFTSCKCFHFESGNIRM